MLRRRVLPLFLASLSVACASSPRPVEKTPIEKSEKATPSPIRLVVWVTIDQLPTSRFETRSRDERGAFHFLREKGRFFAKARYAHANTETAPGHATLFSGTSPSAHGIVANEWWDYSRSRAVPSTLDPSFPLLRGESDPEKTGRSPRALREDTISDVLREKSPAARVYSLSLKDRGAIFPAGKAGKAIWFQEGAFTSSRYYFESLPSFVDGVIPSDALVREWTLLDPLASYESRTRKRSSFAPDYLGVSFPHRPNGATLEQVLRSSPIGDEATLALAESVLVHENLGNGEGVDVLAVSLSSNDYVGHFFGPESLEAEDLLRRTDIRLRNFLSNVFSRVPEERVLVVLSSDHGGSETPEETQRLEGRGGRVLVERVKSSLEKALAEAKIPRKVLAIVPPYAFLDRPAEGTTLGAERARELERLMRKELPSLHALRSTSELAGDDELTRSLRASVRPGVSGELYFVFEPNEHFLQDGKMASTHGSPWDYDREVPVVVFGSGVVRGRCDAPVFVHELAPSVAELLGLDWRGRSAFGECSR